VLNTAFNPWLFEANPVLATRQEFVSVIAGQVLAGVAVEDICLCDNFYTPNAGDGWENWLAAMVDELAKLSSRFRTPFISGKDSSAGSTETDEGVISVPPAVFLTALGKIPDVARLRTEVWQEPGNVLVRIGPRTSSLAGTVAARVLNAQANDVDDIDTQEAYDYISALQRLSALDAVSGRVINAGGVFGALVLGSLASDLAVNLEVPVEGLQSLLEEHRLGALIEVPADRVDAIPADLSPVVIGTLTSDGPGIRAAGVELLSQQVIDAWSQSFVKELS
jgi:phosphoribosylformylglycinamidine (FGAM) synthase-like enzyme